MSGLFSQILLKRRFAKVYLNFFLTYIQLFMYYGCLKTVNNDKNNAQHG